MNLVITRWVPVQPDPVDAAQVTADNFAAIAEWSGALVYTGDKHGHTTPPWSFHSCMIADEGPCAMAGDWIIRLPDGFLVVPAAEFAGAYAPATEEG